MVGIFTFPYRGALLIFTLHRVENGIAPAWAAVPDTLMGVFGCLSTFTNGGSFREDNLSRIREEYDHVAVTTGHALHEGDSGCAHGPNDAREFVAIRRLFSGGARFVLVLRSRRFI